MPGRAGDRLMWYRMTATLYLGHLVLDFGRECHMCTGGTALKPDARSDFLLLSLRATNVRP